jgi:hypothetical protein
MEKRTDIADVVGPKTDMTDIYKKANRRNVHGHNVCNKRICDYGGMCSIDERSGL